MRPNKLGEIHFTSAVLEYSNATPFLVRRRSLIRCIFNCFKDFNLDTLRAHTIEEHTSHLFRAAKGIDRTSIRVDITDLHCKLCKQSLSDLDHFEKHINSQHRIKTFKNTIDVLVPYKLNSYFHECQICHETPIDFYHLDLHMEKHFPLNICEVCGRGFMSGVKLKKHFANEHAEKPFACEICQVRFNTKHLMERHLNYTHKGIGANRCWICPGDVRFKDYAKKLTHMVEVHNEPELPKHKCLNCDKQFRTKSFLERHIETTHERIRRYKCQTCKAEFSQAHKLAQHTRHAHGVVERIVCAQCGRSYGRVRELVKHIKKVHSEMEAQCLCWKCGKACGNRYKLAQHSKYEHDDME